MSYPEGNRVEFASNLKKAVKIPVGAVGKLRTPAFCDQVIKDGKADYVLLGRTLVCDPYWPEKARAGREDEIKWCISCSEACAGVQQLGGFISCVQNPVIGVENKYAILPQTKNKLNIVVVGGGAAGMQAAVTATEIGHDVILLEKSDSLGGQLKLACLPPNKGAISKIISRFASEMNRLNIKYELNADATPEKILNLKPDIVIIATGGMPIAPPIQGIEHGIQAWDYLDGKRTLPVEQKVTVIGGGIVGCELAEMLTVNNCKVTIVEMLDGVALGLEGMHRIELLENFNKCSVGQCVHSTVTKIEPNGVDYMCDGKKEHIDADTIILALGVMPAGGELTQKLREAGVVVKEIGDAQKSGKIINATRDGFFAAIDAEYLASLEP